MIAARRQARTVALQALYEIDCADHAVLDVLPQRLQSGSLPAEAHAFVYQLVNGVLAQQETLDPLIQKYAPEWPVAQMAIIDRNILRMAIFEIAVLDTAPLRVVINEAVELAKAFGADTAPRFINGVLGSLVADEPDLKAMFSQQDVGTGQ